MTAMYDIYNEISPKWQKYTINVTIIRTLLPFWAEISGICCFDTTVLFHGFYFMDGVKRKVANSGG